MGAKLGFVEGTRRLVQPYLAVILVTTMAIMWYQGKLENAQVINIVIMCVSFWMGHTIGSQAAQPQSIVADPGSLPPPSMPFVPPSGPIPDAANKIPEIVPIAMGAAPGTIEGSSS